MNYLKHQLPLLRLRAFRGIVGSIGLLGLSSIATPAIAEESREEDPRIEVIIVTAEKREESVLKVPLTMTAFNSELIKELGMTGDEDLEQLVPGLQFGYDSEGYGIAMRGIGTQVAVQSQADQAVAFYVDGVYSYKTYGTAPNMFDLERVEVARGPQGTLNGRNSIAGSVSFINKRPADEPDMNVLIEYTDQVTQRYGIAFGGPVNENVSYRFTGSYYEGDGTQENVGVGNDYGAPYQIQWAPQLRFTNDKVDVNLRYSSLRDQGSARSRVSVTERDRSAATVLLFGFWVQPNDWFLYDKPVPSVSDCPAGQYTEFGGICGELKNKVLSNRASKQDSNAERWSLNADYELSEKMTLRYTYGENTSHTFGTQDRDGTDRVPSEADPSIPADLTDPADIQRWIDEGGKFRDLEDGWLEDDFEKSHELQVFSSFDGPFNFVAGVYTYENESSWRDRQHDWADPLFTTNADEAATSLDLNRDGVADFSSCQDFLDNFVLAEDDESTPDLVEGLGEEPHVWTHCPAGNDHTFDRGGGAGSTAGTNAVFVNAEYRLNERWQVSGGLRLTEDEKAVIPSISGDHGVGGLLDEIEPDQRLTDMPWGGVPVYFQYVLTDRDASWSKTIGHVSLEYTPRDNLLYYGRVSTGFRAGGFNQIEEADTEELIALGAIPKDFPGSELVNYEVGIKGLFFDSRLLLTAGAYFDVYDKYHLKATQYIGAGARGTREEPFTDYTDGFDGTEIWGFEAEWTFQVNGNWRLSGFYNFLGSSVGPHSAFFQDDRDEERETFIHTYIDRATGMQMTSELELPRDVTGNTLPQQPAHKAAVTLLFSDFTGIGPVTALTTWSFTGDRWSDIGNVPYQKIAGYSRWDARISWEPKPAWEITGYVQNILDEIGIQEFAYGNVWLTEHRQMGVQFRWRPDMTR